MLTKEKILKHLDDFPSEFTIDELIEKLIFIEKLEERIEQSKNKETLSEEEIKNEMKEWFG